MKFGSVDKLTHFDTVVLLSFVGKALSTNTGSVFHGTYIHLDPLPARSSVLLCSSFHPVLLQAGSPTFSVLYSAMIKCEEFYLPEVVEVQVRHCQRVTVVGLLALMSSVKSEVSVTTH